MEETVKPKTSSKVKEKRMAYSQDSAPKKSAKQGLINDMAPLSPPRAFDGSSPVKKLLNEAGKIMKIGMEKDFALLERDTTLQNSTETIDNLRKNILHLQMEYEKLDQNFQREISYRTELIKRMDATRELVESVVQCSNILAASLKQLEDDKLKIAELYELIFQNQQEIEKKHAQTEKFFQEQDLLVQTKMDEIKEFQTKIITQNSDTVSRLNQKLALTSDKLKATVDENEKLQKKIQEIQESSNKLQMFLEQQEKLNGLHRENMITFKLNLKKLKIQRFKYQKMLKNKKKEFVCVVVKNKNLKKNLEKMENLYNDCVSVNKILESRNNELKSKSDEQFENFEKERQLWESKNQELLSQLKKKESEMNDLRLENKNLTVKISDLTTNEGVKRLELEQIQNNLSKMLSENLKLKENVTKLNEENQDKAKTISELEIKTSVVDADLNSKIEFYRNEAGELGKTVKELESQVTDLEKRLGYEKTQKDNVISEFSYKLDQTLKETNEQVNELKKQLEEKTRKIQELESEKTNSALDVKTISQKLNAELQSEIFKNNELNKNFEYVKHNYENVKKQLEEAKTEMTDKEEKITELNSYNKSLKQNQKDLEKDVTDLRKKIDLERKSLKVLEEKHKKAEIELGKMQEVMTENEELKTSTGNLRNTLKETEARLEAYKLVVKKLEIEKIETKNSHSDEVSKLKLEISRLEENIKKDQLRFGTPQKSTDNMKDTRTPVTRSKEKQNESLLSQKLMAKENEPVMGDVEKWRQINTSPIQGGKKFLSTPRSAYTSTPQPNFRSLTPIQKKRDPYEFDSDSSVERFDPDKILKVFNRQKKETNKKPKTTK